MTVRTRTGLSSRLPGSVQARGPNVYRLDLGQRERCDAFLRELVGARADDPPCCADTAGGPQCPHPASDGPLLGLARSTSFAANWRSPSPCGLPPRGTHGGAISFRPSAVSGPDP